MALVVAVSVAGIAWWSLHSLGEEHAAKATAQQPTGQGVSMQDLLADAPTGTEIPAAGRRPVPAMIPVAKADPLAPVLPAPAPVQQQQPVPLDDNMTDAAIQARRAAWATYYQQLADMKKAQFERMKSGMAADTDPQQQAATTLPAGVEGGPLQQLQQQKDKPTDFFSSVESNPATDYLPFTLTDPISPYELKAGDIVTGKLESGLNSDSAGDVRAIVSKNVYDYATGEHILVPQGSRLFGTYATAVAYGQTRVMVAWTRIIYPGPCAQSLDLGAMPGTDQTGQAGFSDITENHYGKIFFNAVLVSLFSAGIQLSQPPSSAFQQYNPIQSAGGAVGQQMGQLGMEFARKGLDIPPTQRIRQGYIFDILLRKDIAFSRPWQEGVCGDTTVQVASQ
jgi:type IV secretory pathway VirB10-like protein